MSDEHEDKVFLYMNRVHQLLEEPQPTVSTTPKMDPSQHPCRQVHEVDRVSQKIGEDFEGLETTSGVDQCLTQLEKHIDSLMSELTDISHEILLLNQGSEELLEQGSSLNKVLYALDLKVKRLLHEQTTSPNFNSTQQANTRVKLSRISVPTFDGNIMNWSSFWEQFEASIHKKESLQDVEKLAYLRDTQKDGSATPSHLRSITDSRKLCQSHQMPAGAL